MASVGAALGATRGALREAHAWLRPSIPDYGFQMIGADYLIDQDMRVSGGRLAVRLAGWLAGRLVDKGARLKPSTCY